ncbi:DUF768 domain-containing protein [Mesorhizobium sp. LSHC414A00]|uniref:DUF768 domain-containing protein n=1 Tax=Mesorhizobium sp. LSHC414A00 TaxID=1287287 RepID=UPI0003CF776D|nr:DUF768 domain-containing protein [Mesorhizobium sp. LSHC414A00]ESX71176.1 hypothetical protein X757_23515 [Mesorhizobium sp. LSHC414A00]
MSVRGLKFFDKWVAKQLPIVAQGDRISVGDLKDQLMTAAEKAGIPADQINGELESVFYGWIALADATSCYSDILESANCAIAN